MREKAWKIFSYSDCYEFFLPPKTICGFQYILKIIGLIDTCILIAHACLGAKPWDCRVFVLILADSPVFLNK